MTSEKFLAWMPNIAEFFFALHVVFQNDIIAERFNVLLHIYRFNVLLHIYRWTDN